MGACGPSSTDEEPAGGPQARLRAGQTNRLVGEITVGGTVHTFSIACEPAVKSQAYLERLPAEHAFETYETVKYKEFLPEAMQLAEVRMTAGSPRERDFARRATNASAQTDRP